MSSEHAQAIDEIHRRVGRNLLRFQRIEESLRFLVPYMNPGPQPLTVERVRAVKERIQDLPLGGLIKEFKRSAAQLDGYWVDALEGMLAARNELVHEFYRNSRFNFLSDDSISKVLTYLDEQHHVAEEWNTILQSHSVVLLLHMTDSNPLMACEYAQYRERLVGSLPPGIEFVDRVQPERTQWASTRLVKLLRLAETKTETVDGMTLLSRAGALIRNLAPELHFANDYGLPSLKEVVVRSGLFDVRVAADGTTVSYRSARELTDPPIDDDPTGLSFTVTRMS